MKLAHSTNAQSCKKVIFVSRAFAKMVELISAKTNEIATGSSETLLASVLPIEPFTKAKQVGVSFFADFQENDARRRANPTRSDKRRDLCAEFCCWQSY